MCGVRVCCVSERCVKVCRVSYRIFCWGGRSNCKGCSSVRYGPQKSFRFLKQATVQR